MLDPVVQSACVVLVSWLLKMWAPIPLDEMTVNSIAAGIVAYLLGLFGLGLVKRSVRGRSAAAWFGKE